MTDMDCGVRAIDVSALPVVRVRRTVPERRAIVEEIGRLRSRLEGVSSGPTVCRLFEVNEDGSLDVELAFPVLPETEIDGFESAVLAPMPALSIIDAEGGARSGGERLAEFVRERGLVPDDDPIRYVYHDDPTAEPPYRVEIQLPDHLPVWLDAFERGVRRALPQTAADRVLAGIGSLGRLDGRRAAMWIQGAVSRLDEALPAEEERADVLNECAHHYIPRNAERLRALYEELGDVRALVDRIGESGILGGRYWIDESGPTPRLYIERRPARPDAARAAESDAERRYQACFCPLVREALRDGRPVSRTFCHCSAGWYVQEWEAVLGRRLRVDLIETMLDGADACRFAVCLPPDLLGPLRGD